MGGAYTAQAPWAPWLKWALECVGDRGRTADDWFAMMTGRHGSQRKQGQFGGWGMFGAQPPFGPPWFGGGGWRPPKARRGDVRSAILAVLAERPMNGYQIIQQLEDEGLVRADEESGRRTFTLTDEGRSYVDQHPDKAGSVWQGLADSSEDDNAFKPLIGQVASAVWQIVAMGTPEQQVKGREALIDFRRKLYAILAEDDTEA
jgi:DNA-binding PadR family transcriptional regulator